jgi:hypothetical protein
MLGDKCSSYVFDVIAGADLDSVTPSLANVNRCHQQQPHTVWRWLFSGE